jgi:hypothetical protein
VAVEGELMNQPDNEGSLAAACTWKIPEKPHLNTLPPAPGPQTPAPAAKVATKRNTRPVQFPVGLRVNITLPMAAALKRISRRLRLPEGVICRLGLMQYLASQDREYREDD